MPHYDVAILGAGPGGYVAAVRAAQLGLSVAIIEEKYWGGVCLNVGCIPSKALLRNADLAHVFHHQAEQFGISGDVHFDFGIAWDRSRKVAETHVKGIHFLMKKNKVTEYEGRGSFVDANTIDVTKADGQIERVTFDNAIISTGSKVRLLPGVAAQRERRDLRGADPHARPAELDRHRRRRRDRHGVRLRAGQLRRQGHDHRVPRSRAAERGRRRVEGDRPSVQEVRRRDPHLDQGRDRRRLTATRSPSPTRPTGRRAGARSTPTRCSCRSASRRTSRTSVSRTPA